MAGAPPIGLDAIMDKSGGKEEEEVGGIKVWFVVCGCIRAGSGRSESPAPTGVLACVQRRSAACSGSRGDVSGPLRCRACTTGS